MTIRAIKTPLKSILIGSFFVFGLFFIILASAQTMWVTDDFESYTIGNLTGQGNWLSGTAQHTQVTEEKSKTGIKSILTGYTGGTTESFQILTNVDTGFQSIWFYPDGTPGGDTMQIGYYFNINGTIQFGFNTNEAYCNTNQYGKFSGVGDGTFISAPCNMDEWNYIEIEWAIDGNLKWKYNINSAGWSDWEDTRYQTIKEINRIRLVGDELYFDDLGILEGELGEYEKDILIIPTYPVDGEITIEDYNFTATGSWEVPEDSSICYRFINIYLEDILIGEISLFSSPIVGNPGTSGNYNISITNLEDKNYYVWYRGSGYLFCIPLMGNIVYTTHRVENTILRVGEYPDLPVELEAQLFYPDSPFEECSGYEILERLVCEIKNFGYSLIYPKPENTVLLKRNLEQIKSKAPFNYISLAKNEFTTMKNQVNQKQITFSLFDNEGVINLEIFNEEFQFAGIDFVFKDLILYFTSFILIIFFIVYLINVVKRIF